MARILSRLAGALTAALLLPTVAMAAPSKDIVGGQPASRAYPFAAYLQIQFPGGAVAKCGGSLVAARYVVTAAHCLDDEGTPPVEGGVSAAIGVSDLSNIPDDKKYFGLGFEAHPQFGSVGGGFDVAVLTLPRPAPEEPLRLPRPADASRFGPGVQGIAIGWGATYEGDPQGSAQLREVALPFLADVSCQPYPGYSPETMLCAGGKFGEDTCQGDSGGPLLAPDGARLMLAGVTSFGAGCGRVPGVYSKVASDPLNTWVRQRVPQVEIDVSPAPPEPGAPATLNASGAAYESYEWDLDNDGAFDDATGPSLSRAFPRGVTTVAVRASRGSGDTADREIRRVDVEARFRSPVSFPGGALTVQEGQSLAVNVSKAGGGEGTVVVVPTTQTAAIGGVDVGIAAPATLAFAGGDGARTLTIPTVDDRIDEPDETFRLELGSHTGELIPGAPAQLVVTIADDDPPPSAAIRSGSRIKVKRGKATIAVSAPGPGAVKLKLTDRAGRLLGTAVTRSVAGTARLSFAVKLNGRARRALKRRRKLAAVVVATFLSRDVSTAVTTRKNVTLRR